VNMSHPPLNDPRVRDAIALAIDKTKIVQTVTYGKERVATGDIPDWIWAARGLPPYGGADVAKAKSILQQAGVRKLSLLLIADAANATHHRVAVELQSMLQGAGIETEIKYYPADLMYAPAGMGGIMHGGRFDLAVETWYAGTDPDNASQFTCAMMPPNGYNDARYCNPEMDALQHEALATNDLALRRDAYRKIEALVVRDHPIIPFWWMLQAEAISDRFSGFSPNPVCESWNSWQWSI
jgi:ABC-type transport system substrate-binding protein